jgi:hypothetical protein
MRHLVAYSPKSKMKDDWELGLVHLRPRLQLLELVTDSRHYDAGINVLTRYYGLQSVAPAIKVRSQPDIRSERAGNSKIV